MTAKLYTDEQIRSFHADYLKIGTKPISTFAKENGLSVSGLWCGFKRLQLEIIPQSIVRQKFPVNNNYFEVIDTEEKAYILGFLYADGCNHEKYHKLEVSLAKQDEDILIKFSKILLNGNINVKEYKRSKTQENRVGLYVVSQKISDDLKKWGCVPRKTLVLKPPTIPKSLESHFIRGYFDGDGMLTVNQRIFNPKQKVPYNNFEFSITSTFELLEWIGEHIAELGASFKINKRHPERNNNNHTLLVFGNHQIKKVCDYLYGNASIYLDRKYVNYQRLIELSHSFRTEISDEQLLGAYKENKNMSLTKLAEKLKISRHTLSKRLKQLDYVI